jgi:hypothetical protein
MNKKGLSALSIIFISLVFIIIWSMALSNIVGEFGHQAVTSNNLSGIEAFLLDNINLVILFIFVVFMIAIGFATG